MSTTDLTFLWLNVGCASVAALVNGWAALRPGPFVEWRPLRAAVGVLAAFYAAAYAVLALDVVPLTTWSPFMRGVSPTVWVVVWIGPVALTHRIWRRARRDAEPQVRQMHAERAERTGHGV